MFLLAACSPPIKYVLVTDRGDVNFGDGDRFYLCLLPDDAKRVNGMVGLLTVSDVKRYERTRPSSSDPLEQVLFDMVRSNYTAAQAGLDKQENGLPPYLRLLLKADLTYETGGQELSATRLIQLYQEAFEDQACGLNKDLIINRIRQVRYGR